ncbi:hypothetical protein [Streptomyces sp. NPDC005407]|uniref:hypothetical protein n=1 Tax=Streptomyces sp. NPDC005407 TaxID=3155340 RepID=UPI0033A55242
MTATTEETDPVDTRPSGHPQRWLILGVSRRACPVRHPADRRPSGHGRRRRVADDPLAVVVQIFEDVERVKAIGLASAGDAGERERISDAFASGLQTSQLVGAVAVLAGGLLAAMPLRRADRAESPRAAE